LSGDGHPRRLARSWPVIAARPFAGRLRRHALCKSARSPDHHGPATDPQLGRARSRGPDRTYQRYRRAGDQRTIAGDADRARLRRGLAQAGAGPSKARTCSQLAGNDGQWGPDNREKEKKMSMTRTIKQTAATAAILIGLGFGATAAEAQTVALVTINQQAL